LDERAILSTWQNNLILAQDKGVKEWGPVVPHLVLVNSKPTLNLSPFSLSFSVSVLLLRTARRERLRKDRAEREDSDKNTSVLAMRAAQKDRDQGMEGNGEDGERPLVESENALRQVRCFVQPPASDYTGCVSTVCTWSLTRARTGPQSSTRIYVCEEEIHESGYYTHFHPRLSRLSLVSVSSYRVAFTCDFSYITAVCWTFDADPEVSHKYTKVCIEIENVWYNNNYSI